MSNLQEEKLVPVVIDLSVNQDQINESWLRQFGAGVELLLKNMFGLNNLNFTMRGPKSSVVQFAKTLKKEKKYIDALKRAGLMDAESITRKSDLIRSIEKFEKLTGIKWPLK